MHSREIKIIILSFVVLIAIGAILLSMPFAHNGHLSFVDAIFTSTSAVCVTGLIVKDTPVDFTSFGHMVILVLIQIGGLGYMSAVTFFAVIRRKKVDHRDRLILKESLNYPAMDGLVRFLKIVFYFVFFIEFAGAIILALRFLADMPLGKALWFGFFHSISAFNNAGFSLFSNNLMNYRGDTIINLVIPFLIILGGIGYIVLQELFHYYKKEVVRLSTHTKIVLYTTLFLILIGMAIVLSLEWSNPASFGSMSLKDKMLSAWFTSVNYRTAGFNTIDFSTLRDPNLFFATFFMMIGGSPGGTAGGIKTTAFALSALGVWFTLRGDKNARIFHRSISAFQINKSYAIVFVASFYVVASSVFLSEIESAPFLKILFEACSAFGTVGISTGDGGVLSLSALFSDFGKFNIIFLMLMGRIGVFAFTIAIVGKAVESRIKYAEGKVIL
ncbi:TrkH family potassium uptake protein [Sulfurimonas sp.]|uniref:TrkH family potassium uptake protein n=1 Tax=Sulfurimonas sp. TaxID=2022749 RepID=UPI0025E4E145|nr:TrkH family potassium uptake protein [Sulfurimonas sp.]MDD5158133.1 TrkH family potassium uptake protein [Sulfurimonas sp.]